MAIRRSSSIHAALAVLLVAGALQAQVMDHAIPSSARLSCLDSIPPAQRTRIPVYASVKLIDSVSPRMRANAENLLQEVVLRVDTLLGARPNVLPVGEPNVTWRGLAAPLTVTVRRDGRLSHALPTGRGDTEAAALFARALDIGSPEARWFDWSADSLRDSVSFQIVLAWPFVDKKGTFKPPRFSGIAVPILSVAHPWEVETAPKPNNAGPRYPEAARRAGYGGLVLMQFLVDTSGRAVMATVRDIWPEDKPKLTREAGLYYESFVESVRAAIAKLEFFPAEIGGCKTAQLVRMPFEFTLAR